ncbi:HBL162Cp [Eremothecium sinecaudum]|uniref:Mitochondrial import inner membrane translocase subunit n=1 Tax=Eremothecium sinecaudum TaxID=45286 RepID=A0A109UWC4_9SACH|nr:HBL162Cp [Eremothecium sinecaudum]AMD18740.1 HBL162Cp [Eremothecium sinecaudum]
MSLFLNPYSSQEVDQNKINVAEIQFDAMAVAFNAMLSSCREKCIPHDHYGEGELTKGEMTCVDRCISKAHDANRTIGTYVQRTGFDPARYLPHYNKLMKSRDHE